MKKEDLKAAIKVNFENNEFATAMELNKELLHEYEETAGKRSATALVNYYRTKAKAIIEEPEVEVITSEQVGNVEDIVPTEEPVHEEGREDEPEYQFNMENGELNINDVIYMLDNGNKALSRYCIIKEEFKQVSDTEQFIQTTMIVKEDGLGWAGFKEVCGKLGGKKGITSRKAGSFWKSECGLPVGEEITKWNIYKVGEALTKYAFRNNASVVRKVITNL